MLNVIIKCLQSGLEVTIGGGDPKYYSLNSEASFVSSQRNAYTEDIGFDTYTVETDSYGFLFNPARLSQITLINEAGTSLVPTTGQEAIDFLKDQTAFAIATGSGGGGPIPNPLPITEANLQTKLTEYDKTAWADETIPTQPVAKTPTLATGTFEATLKELLIVNYTYNPVIFSCNGYIERIVNDSYVNFDRNQTATFASQTYTLTPENRDIVDPVNPTYNGIRTNEYELPVGSSESIDLIDAVIRVKESYE